MPDLPYRTKAQLGIEPAIGEWAARRAKPTSTSQLDESLGWTEPTASKGVGVPPGFTVTVLPVTRTRPDMESLVTEWGRADEEMPTVCGVVRYEDWLVGEAWRRTGSRKPFLAILRDPMGNVALAMVPGLDRA